MRLLQTSIRFARSNKGATALEFALLLPVFLFLLFGILEICLVLLFSMMLSWGSDRGVEYLEKARANYEPVDARGLRAVLCEALEALPVNCDMEQLSIALINQDAPNSNTADVPRPIVNRFDDPNGGIYLLALGYDWNFMFPTTGFVLPFSGPDAQIETVALAVLAERVTEIVK